MAVPPYYEFVAPVVSFLAEANKPVHRKEVRARVAERMDLSEEDMHELAGEKGRTRGVTKVADRTGWALSYASKFGWVEAASRGFWTLSEEGRALVARYPDGVPIHLVREKMAEARSERRRTRASTGGRVSDVNADTTVDPEEAIRAAYEEHRSAVADAVLGQVRAADPLFFEHLVLKLLNAMGYGADDSSLEQTGGSGDGGIDGVISLDKLGLERVYVQAKRYGEGNTVGRPAIQGFLGALTAKNATKGVFITSSVFSREAQDFVADRDGIVLIDGAQLADLMIDHEVGIRRVETLHITEVDDAFFEGD